MLKNKHLIILSLFYLISYGLILINNGIFWDDWLLKGVESRYVNELFSQVGFAGVGYMHSYLLSFDNCVLIYRMLTFSLLFLSGLLIYSILKTVDIINESDCFFLTLFYLIFPLYFARITLIMLPSTLFSFLFFLGFWISIKFLSTKNIILRLLSLLILFLSFNLNSLLLFYVIVLCYFWYYEKMACFSINNILAFLYKYIDFIFLPVVYYLIKLNFFKPSGIYADYNSLNLKGIITGVFKVVLAFYYSFVKVIDLSITTRSVVLLSVFSAFIYLLFLTLCPLFKSRRKDSYLFIFGIIVFFLGAYPSCAVDKIPTFIEFESRLQVLLPLGCSFILFYGIKILMAILKADYKLNIFLYSILAVTFVFYNFSVFLQFQIDWYKQCALIENFKSNEMIKKHTTILFEDLTIDDTVLTRRRYYYEYNGMFKLVFGDEIRLGVDKEAWLSPEFYKKYLNPTHNMRNYVPKNPEIEVIINNGRQKIASPTSVMKLRYYEIFNTQKFKEDIKSALSLETFVIKD